MLHADKWGPIGSVVSALCCLGVAPALSALAAVGLGFLIHDWILIPLLTLFLGVTVRALHRDRPRHGHEGPERLGWVGSALTLVGLWVSGLIVGGGLAFLIGATAWNGWIIHQNRARGAGC